MVLVATTRGLSPLAVLELESFCVQLSKAKDTSIPKQSRKSIFPFILLIIPSP
ncbi:hypothetical protein GXM_01879 [Nostoc sphaeroides CCNUC1]|uniref:Uncharacterized protein n=1 Tax=Nostoc sphaeroides CCNUC1 TaxID=2653204 RepID=A0A5P8VVK4_9NOSO|nr:hypothetical protein GXM_01879 [Nostoc sphaeroides CCNUC1]